MVFELLGDSSGIKSQSQAEPFSDISISLLPAE